MVISLFLINTYWHICPAYVLDNSTSTYLIVLFVWGELLPAAQPAVHGSTQTDTHTYITLYFLCLPQARTEKSYLSWKITCFVQRQRQKKRCTTFETVVLWFSIPAGTCVFHDFVCQNWLILFWDWKRILSTTARFTSVTSATLWSMW